MKENELNKVPENEVKETKEKKPGLFRRIGRGIKSGFRKVRESPAATMIGVGIGAVVTGAGLAVAHLVSAKAFVDDEEPIEQEFEDEEVEETEDEEVQNDEVA